MIRWSCRRLNTTYTEAQVLWDWFPEDHPPLPNIVANGRTGDPNATACATCHLINGKGRPENASVSGLPVSYFLQQLNDFRNDLRKSAEPRKANSNRMILIAKALTPEEMRHHQEMERLYRQQVLKEQPTIQIQGLGMLKKQDVQPVVHKPTI